MLNQMKCCGVHEIDGISFRSPEDSLRAIYNDEHYNNVNSRGGFLIFTDRAEKEYTYAQTFKNYILEHKLGNVLESNARPNSRYLVNNTDPKVTHDLKVFIWEVDHEAFAKWYEYNKLPEQVVVKDNTFGGWGGGGGGLKGF